MRVLVTGVAGLIGAAIAEKLLNNNYYVTGICHSKSSNITHQNFTEVNIDLSKGDIKIKGKFDCVIHCAALIPKPGIDPEILEIINQKIDNAILAFVKANRIKLIYFSTAFMYGEREKLLTEDSKLSDNLKGYYLSKANSERKIINEINDYVIFRISSPYGNLNKQNNVMKLFVENCKNKLPITLIDRGQREQNFIHIDDISEACLIVLKNNIVGLYNLTYEVNYSMLQLANSIKSTLNSTTEILFDKLKTDSQPNVNFSNSKVYTTFNWKPKIDLESGLLRTLTN